MTNTKKFSGYSFNKVFEKTNLITIGKVVGVIILIVLGFVLLKKIVAFFNNPFGFGSVGEKTQNVLLAFTAMRLEYNWQSNSVDNKKINNLKNQKLIKNQMDEVLENLIH